MPVIVALFGLVSLGFGFTLWQEKMRRRRAAEGRPLPTPGGDPGSAVDIDWLGDNAVVKVYYLNNAYTAHVYWRDTFIGQAGGFGSSPDAIGWGRSHARAYGADV